MQVHFMDAGSGSIRADSREERRLREIFNAVVATQVMDQSWLPRGTPTGTSRGKQLGRGGYYMPWPWSHRFGYMKANTPNEHEALMCVLFLGAPSQVHELKERNDLKKVDAFPDTVTVIGNKKMMENADQEVGSVEADKPNPDFMEVPRHIPASLSPRTPTRDYNPACRRSPRATRPRQCTLRWITICACAPLNTCPLAKLSWSSKRSCRRLPAGAVWPIPCGVHVFTWRDAVMP
jgi:hypothetical protein